MKIRVFKRIDGSLIYNIPSDRYNGDVISPDGGFYSIDDCPIPSICEGLPFIIADDSELPISNSIDGNYHEQIYCDGDLSIENIKIDSSWDKYLMPPTLIYSKHVSKLNRVLADEFDKEDKDVNIVSCLRAMHEKSSMAKYGDSDWYSRALKNLDARVAGGEHDKPVIRQKLIDKIAELESKEGE